MTPFEPSAAVSANRPVQANDLEIWGGVEYTCNRVRDRYFDQMELSGHAQRLDDYDRFAELGLRTLRVGTLWERHACDPSWAWSDARLARLRALGIRPIASLVHHGGGPRNTSLDDPDFGRKLASYAEEFAERYPWVDAYTPVNEPHTTARFSGMYGIWYPHALSRRIYLRALLHQLKGTVLSMQAIRRINPGAQLIQTEDLGTISGTEVLRPTWELLDLRRWLPFDLLCGRIDHHHPMFAYLRDAGLTQAEILWFAEHPCAPDLIGVNYYVTSDRFLDHRLEYYPENRRSAEGPFVDVEAVRVQAGRIGGVEPILAEAWERYRIPTAITEVHLGCTAEEQIRWLMEIWRGANAARAKGVDCRALTVWALLGSFYWNELVTRENGHYEPGVFDMRSGKPVLTELANIVAQLTAGKTPSHHALSQKGWWAHPNRICFPLEVEIAA